ncbi:hypothetical protein QR680_011486 [Steinernema hermaphroditum]|uniref:Uncharacterized protein n=1 Tax=Steinernema hermaphroditum TaxID=289476 RepID=A0AA39LYS5_9BILA|nr:hypothetical protein QR680_011486 [Steinernema hermaphroditum]
MFSKHQSTEKAESSQKKKLFQNENEDDDLRQLASERIFAFRTWRAANVQSSSNSQKSRILRKKMNFAMKKIIDNLLKDVAEGSFATVNFYHPSIQSHSDSLKSGRFSTSTRQFALSTANTLKNVLEKLSQSQKGLRYDDKFIMEVLFFEPPRGK